MVEGTGAVIWLVASFCVRTATRVMPSDHISAADVRPVIAISGASYGVRRFAAQGSPLRQIASVETFN